MGYFALETSEDFEKLVEAIKSNCDLWLRSPDCDYLADFIIKHAERAREAAQKRDEED